MAMGIEMFHYLYATRQYVGAALGMPDTIVYAQSVVHACEG